MPDCRYYHIAGLTVQVESDLPITGTTFHPKFTRFEVAGPGDDPIVIRHHVGMPDLTTMDWGRCVYRKAPWAIYQNGKAWIYLIVPPGTNDTEASQMAILSDDHTRADMYHAREDLFRTGNWHSLTLFPTDQILLSRVLADRRGGYLHAAGAILNGHGLLFAGHSDAGKTTMTRMLLAAGTRTGGGGNEVEILCDDRIIVRKWGASSTGDGHWRIHGTWSHGEAPEVSPNTAPLSAILFLEQARENRIIPLRDRKEIITRLLACLITPLTCAEWWEKSLTVVEQIAREALCYILRFDKSGEVVGTLESFFRTPDPPERTERMVFGRAIACPPRMQRIEDRPIANAALRELVRAVLDKGVPFRFQAPGCSMWPFIRNGDVVTIAPFVTRRRAPRIGEVVVFVLPNSGRLTIHRVIAARGGWLMRGDHCPEADGVVAREDILGVVTRVERGGRSVGLGLGAERRLIAWLSGREWLMPLKQFVLLPRRPASALLRRLQCIPAFRAWVKRFRPVYSIDEATPCDLIAAQAWMNPGSDAIPAGPMPGVTNYVVKRGNHLLGFVQLVRHPKEHFPYVGAWLFSLVVRGRYRGMGIGEALTRRVIEQAQSERAPELRLLVFADNTRAINVYRKLGFEVVDAPEFAQPLDDEARQTGRRRVVMHCSLEKDQSKNV